MTHILASTLVFLTGLYFVGLATVSLLAPARATQFLLGFAGSASAHYLELLIRLLVGGAFLLCAPEMLFSGVFVAFGWVLVITTACLFAVPWRWHQRFAQRSVPYAVRNLKLVGMASLALGILIVTALLVSRRGPRNGSVTTFQPKVKETGARPSEPPTPIGDALRRKKTRSTIRRQAVVDFPRAPQP